MSRKKTPEIVVRQEYVLRMVNGLNKKLLKEGMTPKDVHQLGMKLGFTSGRGAYEHHLNRLADKGLLTKNKGTKVRNSTLYTVKDWDRVNAMAKPAMRSIRPAVEEQRRAKAKRKVKPAPAPGQHSDKTYKAAVHLKGKRDRVDLYVDMVANGLKGLFYMAIR